jgi:hypothetical protein
MKKRTWFLALAAILAMGVWVIGCDNGTTDPGPTIPAPPASFANYLTEAAILAGTGHGGTSVTKISDGKYQVTGTVTAYSNWDNSVNDSRIMLNIGDSILTGLPNAAWYTIIYDLPNSTVKPFDRYTTGFSVYLENTTSWAGTWKHEYAEEYNTAGGVGKVAIARDLSKPAESDEVGEYHHLVSVFKFDAAHVGQPYTFEISNVGVWYDPSFPPE